MKMKDRMKYFRIKVYRFIVLFTKNEDLAEDLTQDVMLKVWIHRDQILSKKDMDNYILKIAKHHVLDHFKKLAKEKAYQEEIWIYMKNNTNYVESPLISREIEEEVDVIILTLPPRQKEIYTLNQRKGLTLDEIATALDIAPRTARNHLNRAIKEIRSQMNPDSFLIWVLFVGYWWLILGLV